MLRVKSEPMELRGLVNKTSPKGNLYYVINAEDKDGNPYALYCPSAESIQQGLKKSDMVSITFEVRRFKNTEQLVVVGVEKVR